MAERLQLLVDQVEGFGPWRQVEHREWARADKEGVPALRLQQSCDGTYQAVMFVADREQ